MLPSWAADTVEIVHPAWREERGKRMPDYRNPETVETVGGCSGQPGATSEIMEGRQQTSIRFTLLAPPGTRIGAFDAVRWRGILYQVDGDAHEWRSPTGAVSHVFANLADWKG